jgi:polyphenol oxidase
VGVFAWHEDRSGVVRAVTDRSDGVSRGRYSGLNLGAHVDDAPDAVTANRRLLTERLGRPVVYMDQCHGAEVAVVDGVPDVPPSCDGLVTRSTEVALAVLVADCVPVLLAAPGEGVVAVAHAGRSGMTAGVVAAAVDAMRDLGAREIVARVGPSVCPRCYPVPLDLREQVATVEPVSRSVAWDGRPSVDVAAGVLAQLARLGVAARQLPGCTVESPGLYSYRRDGRTGRFAGLVWRAAGEAA